MFSSKFTFDTLTLENQVLIILSFGQEPIPEAKKEISLPGKQKRKSLKEPADNMTRFTIDLPKNLHRQFKNTTMIRNETMADMVRKWADAYVKKHGNKELFK